MTLSPEDQKLVTLARTSRARTQSSRGAAVRDLDGRTYAGASVDLPSLRVSAVGVVVAMALASGSRGAEAVVVLTDGDLAESDLAVVRDFAGGAVPVHRGTPEGRIEETLTS